REAVHENLPVALQLSLEFINLMRPVEGIPLDSVRELAEVVAQRLGVVRVEIDEDEAFPDIALDRRHAAAVGVEVEQQVFSRGRMQQAVKVVAPPMEPAVQQRRSPLHLLERVVLPQDLVAAMRADVVERANYVVLAP